MRIDLRVLELCDCTCVPCLLLNACETITKPRAKISPNLFEYCFSVGTLLHISQPTSVYVCCNCRLTISHRTNVYVWEHAVCMDDQITTSHTSAHTRDMRIVVHWSSWTEEIAITLLLLALALSLLPLAPHAPLSLSLSLYFSLPLSLSLSSSLSLFSSSSLSLFLSRPFLSLSTFA